MEEKRAGRRKRSRRGWHCSWVSAPKRSAKIVSAQIKLWPLPGRPRISAPFICLSNETPAHREPSGSPSHTHTKVLAHADTNSVGNTHRHRCITHYAYTCLPLMVSLLHSNLFLLRERERERVWHRAQGFVFLLWTSQINTLPPSHLLSVNAAHTRLTHLHIQFTVTTLLCFSSF